MACAADMLRHAGRARAFRHPAFVSTCGCLGSLQLSAEAGDVFACLLVRQLLQLLGCLYSSDTVCSYAVRVCVSQHTPCSIFTYTHTYMLCDCDTHLVAGVAGLPEHDAEVFATLPVLL